MSKHKSKASRNANAGRIDLLDRRDDTDPFDLPTLDNKWDHCVQAGETIEQVLFKMTDWHLDPQHAALAYDWLSERIAIYNWLRAQGLVSDDDQRVTPKERPKIKKMPREQLLAITRWMAESETGKISVQYAADHHDGLLLFHGGGVYLLERSPSDPAVFEFIPEGFVPLTDADVERRLAKEERERAKRR